MQKESEHHQQRSDHAVYQVDVTVSGPASPVLACSQVGGSPQGASSISNQHADYPVTNAGHISSTSDVLMVAGWINENATGLIILPVVEKVSPVLFSCRI